MNINRAAAETYLRFVQERHRVWQLRQAGAPQPWTSDPVLATRKFTNVYRLLDPGSQFVITDLQPASYGNPEDYLARCFFYRYTNLPETWRHMKKVMGYYPSAITFEAGFTAITNLIKEYRDEGNKVFSGAYVILPMPNVAGDKVEQAVELARQVFSSDLPQRFFLADTQPERFNLLRSIPGCGPFLAMQILTDYGYGTEFREDEFVIAGPGSRKGCAELDPHSQPEDVIRWAHEAVQLGTTVELEGRPPSLMDIQNTFCEFSKYVKGPRANTYRPAHPGAQPAPVLPRNWRNPS